mgnify:CR=1 FL=1
MRGNEAIRPPTLASCQCSSVWPRPLSVVTPWSGFAIGCHWSRFLRSSPAQGLDSIVRAVQERRLAELGGYAAAATAAVLVSQRAARSRNTNVAGGMALTGSAPDYRASSDRRGSRASRRGAAARSAVRPGVGTGWGWRSTTPGGCRMRRRPWSCARSRLIPDSSRATFHLALVHERAGDLSAAGGYARALTLSPFDRGGRAPGRGHPRGRSSSAWRGTHGGGATR